jgi:hypothetical protein
VERPDVVLRIAHGTDEATHRIQAQPVDPTG